MRVCEKCTRENKYCSKKRKCSHVPSKQDTYGKMQGLSKRGYGWNVTHKSKENWEDKIKNTELKVLQFHEEQRITEVICAIKIINTNSKYCISYVNRKMKNMETVSSLVNDNGVLADNKNSRGNVRVS